jgi:hypothetical protein
MVEVRLESKSLEENILNGTTKMQRIEMLLLAFLDTDEDGNVAFCC